MDVRQGNGPDPTPATLERKSGTLKTSMGTKRVRQGNCPEWTPAALERRSMGLETLMGTKRTCRTSTGTQRHSDVSRAAYVGTPAISRRVARALLAAAEFPTAWIYAPTPGRYSSASETGRHYLAAPSPRPPYTGLEHSNAAARPETVLRPILRVNPSLRASQQRPVLNPLLERPVPPPRPSPTIPPCQPADPARSTPLEPRPSSPTPAPQHPPPRHSTAQSTQQQSPGAPKSSRRIIRINNIRVRKRSHRFLPLWPSQQEFRATGYASLPADTLSYHATEPDLETKKNQHEPGDNAFVRNLPDNSVKDKPAVGDKEIQLQNDTHLTEPGSNIVRSMRPK
ncbi:hypothetical protein DFH07DRAFT_966877 [Mycena maculata]|uniref:Uncharacterized protein n=1 Tax=Mycena maculata TaxID=230809 RepID=A0AAD7I6T3_9AGAR|nr:hypothetical protein DFH07DRAFT_966877 [Mycena maculata]